MDLSGLITEDNRSVIYVARQLGHDATLTLKTYGVIDELEDAPAIAPRTRSAPPERRCRRRPARRPADPAVRTRFAVVSRGGQDILPPRPAIPLPVRVCGP
jgi:hypothetical protein